jgi:hypothetical protein
LKYDAESRNMDEILRYFEKKRKEKDPRHMEAGQKW